MSWDDHDGPWREKPLPEPPPEKVPIEKVPIEKVIGTCSLCRGPVVEHVGPYSRTTGKPSDRCKKCGAARKSYGPVIEMEAPRDPIGGMDR
jgi:hypothetical protein